MAGDESPASRRHGRPEAPPDDAEPLPHPLPFHFTDPTYVRSLAPAAAAVPRTLGSVAPATAPATGGSRPRRGLQLGRASARLLLDRVVPDGPVELGGGDSAAAHSGASVRHGPAPRPKAPLRSPLHEERLLALLALVRSVAKADAGRRKAA